MRSTATRFTQVLVVLATISTLCNGAAVTSSFSQDVCQKPANITLANQSAADLCANANCVNMGEATLTNNGSQICQAPKQTQGVFTCIHRSEYINKATNTLEQVGKGICAMPADSTTFGLYSCENGAKINVYTKKDGTASFYISRLTKEAPGVAGYESEAKGHKDGCKPRDIIGDTDVVNDKLFIDYDGYEKVCPVYE